MADYIKKTEVLDILWESRYRPGLYKTLYWGTWNDIKNLPAADVAPIIHAKWEMGRVYVNGCEGSGEEKAFCSHCHKSNKQYTPPYCPHCGAKMEEEDTDEKA